MEQPNIMKLLNNLSVGHLIKMCIQPVKRKSPSAKRRDKKRMEEFLQRKDQEKAAKQSVNQENPRVVNTETVSTSNFVNSISVQKETSSQTEIQNINLKERTVRAQSN